SQYAPLHSLSSSNRGLLLIEGPGLDHREQDIEPTTSQTHHRSIMAFTLSPFPVVIRLRQRIMTRRHPRRVEQRVLQPFVTRPRREHSCESTSPTDASPEQYRHTQPNGQPS